MALFPMRLQRNYFWCFATGGNSLESYGAGTNLVRDSYRISSATAHGKMKMLIEGWCSEPGATRHGRENLRRGPLCGYPPGNLSGQRGECATAWRDCELNRSYYNIRFLWKRERSSPLYSHALPSTRQRADNHATWPRLQDLDKDDYIPEGYTQSTPEEVQALVKKQVVGRKQGDKVKQQKLGALGFEAEHSGEVLF